MTEKTKQYLIILYGTLLAVVLLSGFVVYMYEIISGQANVPVGIENAFANFVVTGLGALGTFFVFVLMRRQNETIRQQSEDLRHQHQQTQSEVAKVNYKLENGIKADQREIKQQVALLVERVPDERQVGGQRLSDPPCADLSPNGGIRSDGKQG